LPETKTESLRESVRVTAHDLSNTLSVLNLTIDLLERDQIDSDSATAQIRQHIHEASRLVQRLQREARSGA